MWGFIEVIDSEELNHENLINISSPVLFVLHQYQEKALSFFDRTTYFQDLVMLACPDLNEIFITAKSNLANEKKGKKVRLPLINIFLLRLYQGFIWCRLSEMFR